MAVYRVEVGLGLGRLQAKGLLFSQGMGLGAAESASPRYLRNTDFLGCGPPGESNVQPSQSPGVIEKT